MKQEQTNLQDQVAANRLGSWPSHHAPCSIHHATIQQPPVTSHRSGFLFHFLICLLHAALHWPREPPLFSPLLLLLLLSPSSPCLWLLFSLMARPVMTHKLMVRQTSLAIKCNKCERGAKARRQTCFHTGHPNLCVHGRGGEWKLLCVQGCKGHEGRKTDERGMKGQERERERERERNKVAWWSREVHCGYWHWCLHYRWTGLEVGTDFAQKVDQEEGKSEKRRVDDSKKERKRERRGTPEATDGKGPEEERFRSRCLSWVWVSLPTPLLTFSLALPWPPPV